LTEKKKGGPGEGLQGKEFRVRSSVFGVQSLPVGRQVQSSKLSKLETGNTKHETKSGYEESKRTCPDPSVDGGRKNE
jgi:hypothetical protein